MSLPRPLIQRFVRHLGEVEVKLAAIEVRLASDRSTEDVLEPLSALAHKLAGTADAYGFPAVGACARSLQQAAAGEPGFSAALAGSVAELRKALEDAVASEPS